MQKITFLILIFLFPLFAFCQFPGMGGGQADKIYDGKISGIVIDSLTRKPVQFANIVLYKSGSTKPLDGTVTDEKGSFRLKNIKNGKYKVVISFIGYHDRILDAVEITDAKTSVELGTIQFAPDAKTLGEVTVEESAPLVETKIDRLVYNAEKDLTAKGGTGVDVMRRVPMVSVDLDGNVMLQGTANVKILINDKPSSIMANSVSDALKMIPADEISKIEVITSPSAKYDAEGTGGIINIVTKRNNMQGVSGSVNASAGTRSSNLFSNINYRHDRFGTGISLGGFGYYGKGEQKTERVTDYSVLTQSGKNKNYGAGPYIQWNGDYDLNSHSNISGSFRYRDFHQGSKSNLLNDFEPISGPVAVDYVNNSDSKTHGGNYDASLDYKHTFHTEGQELFLSFQQGRNKRNTHYDVTRDDLSGHTYYAENSINEGINLENTFQADYSHPFSKKVSVDVGGKTIMRDVTSDYDYNIYDFPSDAYVDDSLRSNVFDYNQDVKAGYAQASWMPSNFGVKAGLRYERTDVKGKYDKDIAGFSNGYDNYLPSATVSYKKGAKYNIKLSYTERIQRPGMNFLNPYVNQSDSFNISKGNPQLEAELSHAFELSTTFFKKFGSITVSGFHRFTNNAIESVRYVDTNDIYVTTYANIGRNYTTGGSISGNVLWQKLILNANANVSYYKVVSTDETNNQTNDGVNYNINLFGSYKFTDRWGVQAFGNFNGPRYSIQGKSTSMTIYSLGARYEFKNTKGGLGMGVDNFLTPYQHFRNEYSGQGFTYNSDNKILFFGVRVNFDYRFGKMEFKQNKKRGTKNDDLKDDNGDQMMGGGR